MAVSLAAPVCAQSPAGYVLAHLAGGIPTVADAAARGRGGVRTAAMDLLGDDLNDPEGGSPAQVAGPAHRETDVEAGSLEGPLATTRFLSLRYLTPLPHGQGLLVHWLTMGGSGQVPVAPGLLGRLTIKENALAFSWGIRSTRSAFGVAFAPRLATDTRVSVGGAEVMHTESNVLLRMRARWSASHKISRRARVAFDSDTFDEAARLSLPATPVPQDVIYRTRTYRVGASLLASPNTVLGADYEWSHFVGADTKAWTRALYAGIEQRVAPRCVLRGGAYAKRPSVGAGYRGNRVRVDVAYVQGVSDQLIPLFGGNPSLWTGSLRWEW